MSMSLEEIILSTEKTNSKYRDYLETMIEIHGYVHVYNLDGGPPVVKLDATSTILNFCGDLASLDIHWGLVSEIAEMNKRGDTTEASKQMLRSKFTKLGPIFISLNWR